MELARIVAMLMIVIGHFILTYGLWNGSDFISRQDVTQPVSSYLYAVFYSLCVIGVNVFILISGYFTIHLTWKSFLSYYFLCIFYNAAVFLIGTFMFDAFSWKALVKLFLVDKTVNWFFRGYFWLMLISPLLNKALEHLSLQELRIGVSLLMFLNCFSVFVLQEYNTNGYNVYNFVFLYVLGNWISKETYTQNVSQGGAIAVYLGGCLLSSLAAIFILLKTDMSIRQIFAYNNPLIVFASTGLVLFFPACVLPAKRSTTSLRRLSRPCLSAYLLYGASVVEDKHFNPSGISDRDALVICNCLFCRVSTSETG